MQNNFVFTAFVATLYFVSLTDATSGTSFYYQDWCGGELAYLDDSNCAKRFPSSYDRDFSCPILSSLTSDQLVANGYTPDTNNLSKLKINTAELDKLVTAKVNVCLALTKRIKNSQGAIELYNKYFCNSNSATLASETWSNSKIFAIADAAGHLRKEETKCTPDLFGIDSSSSGKDGVTPLGDLATVVVSYDETAGYSSNSLASYFLDIGWRSRLNSLVTTGTTWLGLPNLQLGGNYGESTPSDLSFSLSAATDSTKKCSVDKDPKTSSYYNSLSTLALAEMTRRIALHNDLNPSLRFPNATWTDMKNILYGAGSASKLFPGESWGGMSADTAIFAQSVLNMTEVESESQGKWRILSKLGAGYSSSRHVGEIISTPYVCIPKYNYAKYGSEGYEFTISVRSSIPNDPTLVSAQKEAFNGFTQAIGGIVSGLVK